MKNIFKLTVLGLIIPFTWLNAQSSYKGEDPQGTISYSLPLTSITLEVEAVHEKFYAGPYARFASKYLGIEVRQSNESTYHLSSVNLNSYIEADHSRRFTLNTNDKAANIAALKLTSCGLISSSDANSIREDAWRFKTQTDGDFTGMGLSSNLTYESTTLYSNQKNNSSYNRVGVQQEMVVEKSPEARAAETAEVIFSLREKRMDIITGNTDATYSGEAMGAAIEEIARLEKEYLTLFTGYSEYSEQKKSFDIIPDPKKSSQLYMAFRLSDKDGLLPADNIAGKPVVLEIIPQEIQSSSAVEERGSKALSIYYRIPAICNIKLTDGINTLIQSRIPIYQFGKEANLPVSIVVK